MYAHKCPEPTDPRVGLAIVYLIVGLPGAGKTSRAKELEISTPALRLTPDEWQGADEQSLADLRATGSSRAFEKEYMRKDGSRLPVLVGAAAFGGPRDQGVAFVLDLTERKQAEQNLRESERRYREAQAELAHVTRVTTLGELTASIAHEVNQPMAAVVTNGDPALQWLESTP